MCFCAKTLTKVKSCSVTTGTFTTRQQISTYTLTVFKHVTQSLPLHLILANLQVRTRSSNFPSRLRYFRHHYRFSYNPPRPWLSPGLEIEASPLILLLATHITPHATEFGNILHHIRRRLQSSYYHQYFTTPSILLSATADANCNCTPPISRTTCWLMFFPLASDLETD